MILEGVLNRWRGTGKIIGPVSGTNIYTLYIAVVIGLLADSLSVALVASALFMLGESAGWGKWVGTACYPNNSRDLEVAYKDKEGYGWPWIHWIANFFIKEREDFLAYCNLALFFRGVYWWLGVYATIVVAGVVNPVLGVISVVILGLCFPFACWLSDRFTMNYENRFICIKGAWETQEFYYGLMQGLVFWFNIIYNTL